MFPGYTMAVNAGWRTGQYPTCEGAVFILTFVCNSLQRSTHLTMSPRNPEPIESLLLPLKPASLQWVTQLSSLTPDVFTGSSSISEHRWPTQCRNDDRPLLLSCMNCRSIVDSSLFVGRKGDLYVLLSTFVSFSTHLPQPIRRAPHIRARHCTPRRQVRRRRCR